MCGIAGCVAPAGSQPDRKALERMGAFAEAGRGGPKDTNAAKAYYEKAAALGYEPLGYVRSYAYASLAPSDQLLQGPVYATPTALDRAGLSMKDIEMMDMHEAFAAQVLCTLRAWESEDYCRTRLGLDAPLGRIDPARINPVGSSLATGHPFAATGARIVATAARQLAERGGGRCLVSICTAGGMGVVAILER